MKKIMLFAAVTFPLLSTQAYADMASEIATARAEAVAASTAADMETVQLHLHRAMNCMVSADNGSYTPWTGAPCEGQGMGATNDTTLVLQKKRLQDALTSMGSGCNQSELAMAHLRANEAVKQLDQAKASTD